MVGNASFVLATGTGAWETPAAACARAGLVRGCMHVLCGQALWDSRGRVVSVVVGALGLVAVLCWVLPNARSRRSRTAAPLSHSRVLGGEYLPSPH